jgi:hypothetical protein
VLNWLPSKMPAALRLSLESQLGPYRITKKEPEPGPLPRLKAVAAKLSPDFAAWVKALDVSKSAQLVAALRANPLPAEVRQAFVAVCERCLEWVVRRELRGEQGLPVPRLAGPGEKDLAEFVDAVLRFAWEVRKRSLGTVRNIDLRLKAAPNDPVWYRDWLLRLFEQHAAGTLDPEGRTR